MKLIWAAGGNESPLGEEELTLTTVTAGQSNAGQLACDFTSAAAQLLSPRTALMYARHLAANDPLLFWCGLVLCGAVPLFAAAGMSVGDLALAVNPWIKPIKFAISFASFLWTAASLLLWLSLSPAMLRTVRCTLSASVAVEMMSLTIQAWRSAHFSLAGRIDALATMATNGAIFGVTAATVWLLYMYCEGRARIHVPDQLFITAVRLGLSIFLIGNAIGGYMLARGSHTVGALDNGPGLPFLKWSTVAGDLRIAHFIALHAIQVLPLFAYLLLQMEPQLHFKARRRALWIAALLLMLVVGGTFIQAAIGQPLIASKTAVQHVVAMSRR